MEMNNDVTVLIPTLNRASLLRHTLDSAVAQSTPCRIVVLDDGSTDDTKEVCRSFGDSVEYQRNERTLGLFANWNRGLETVDTEFAAIFHDDDVYHPAILGEEAALLRRHPEMVMAHSGCQFIDDEGRPQDTHLLAWPTTMRGSDFRRVLAGLFSCPVVTPSVMLRTDAIRDIGGFDETLRVSGDLAAWFDIADRGTVGYVPRPLVSVRTRGRYANEHARFDWSVVDEHLAVATRTKVAIEGRLDWKFGVRADWYLSQLLLHELLEPSGTDPAPVVHRHGGRSPRLLAQLLPRLPWLRPLLRALRPGARDALRSAGRLHRRVLAHQAAATKSRRPR
jgi:glycosyltransferase involved in cell wall biosynthesis